MGVVPADRRAARQRGGPVERPIGAPEPTAKESRPVRWRAFVVGAAFIPPLLYWQFQLEMKRYSFPTWAAPFYHVIFLMWWLALANLLLRRRWPRLALTGGELLLVYVMLSIAAGLFSVDLLAILVSTIAYPFQFPSAANEHLPRWLVVHDVTALRHYYSGYSSLYLPEHLRAWAGPVFWWSLFLLVLVGVMLGINWILRRQWIERERLSYPIAQLPLGMAMDTGAFIRQRALWIGFAVAAVITVVNGLHFWVPTIPTIPVKRQDLLPFFPNRPWNAIGWTEWSMYPFAIGLSFFIPLDLSFSIWVFFLLAKLELVAGAAAGYDASSKFPYPHQQSLGAYLAILLMALWMSRGYLRELVRAAFSRQAGPEERGNRWAILGVVAGTLFLLGFAIRAGMPPVVAVLFLGLYLALVVMITRIRAELGFAVHDLAWVGPHQQLVAVAGPATLGPGSLAGFGIFYGLVRRFTSHPMPHQLEGLKMAQVSGTAPRGMVIGILLAAFLGIVGGFWLYLHRYYQVGAESAYWNGWTVWLGAEAINTYTGWLNSAAPPDRGAAVALGFGFVFAWVLSLLRLRLAHFPLHPLAYAVAPSWGMANLWSCVFLAWLAKLVVLRWAGLKGYRRAGPFFLGLVLGEFVCGAGWTLLGVLIDQPSYDFWP
jgi:hypothetical protein